MTAQSFHVTVRTAPSGESGFLLAQAAMEAFPTCGRVEAFVLAFMEMFCKTYAEAHEVIDSLLCYVLVNGEGVETEQEMWEPALGPDMQRIADHLVHTIPLLAETVDATELRCNGTAAKVLWLPVLLPLRNLVLGSAREEGDPDYA
jgi:hypothetical protein